jgi:hypothetical protein
MKRTICFLVASTFLFSSVKAQLCYGVKAGASLTSLPGDGNNNYSKYGFFAGVSGAVALRKSLFLQAELYYSAQGNKVLVTYTDPLGTDEGEEKVSNRLNYINLPVLAKYEHASGFFVETGLQAGLLVSAQGKSSRGTSEIKDIYRSFDLSWPIGAGSRFKNGLGMNVRYNFGLINLYKRGIFTVHNSVVQAGLFYTWKKH